jgi:hypothetical protein
MNEPTHTTVAHLRFPDGHIHTYVDVYELDPPKDYRHDRDPKSPLHDLGDLRWLFESTLRRYSQEAGLPSPGIAAYVHWRTPNGKWHYFARFAGQTFRASGPTRRKALRKLTKRMFAISTFMGHYVQFRQAADGNEWRV